MTTNLKKTCLLTMLLSRSCGNEPRGGRIQPAAQILASIVCSHRVGVHSSRCTHSDLHLKKQALLCSSCRASITIPVSGYHGTTRHAV
ncbi:uncharacterized protein BO66DRAFT_184774 [Aspergillus aculeatinus CBS 121060]|uniref:Uncharacterized protein n=1 Tax=Aspergillus aculeatinus CBS 121060 TaxID=1448322 RepID=A0ACD1GYY0_9EURO|nr:hypothetical protein BO66DRAFT_184774 [Aspergillus aculeatinus CBS 121060]RAH66414.1 hypothetical protein BO66DRAFT_184774 [Aspergillus aculeatinus CBS 121060]